MGTLLFQVQNDVVMLEPGMLLFLRKVEAGIGKAHFRHVGFVLENVQDVHFRHIVEVAKGDHWPIYKSQKLTHSLIYIDRLVNGQIWTWKVLEKLGIRRKIGRA